MLTRFMTVLQYIRASPYSYMCAYSYTIYTRTLHVGLFSTIHVHLYTLILVVYSTQLQNFHRPQFHDFCQKNIQTPTIQPACSSFWPRKRHCEQLFASPVSSVHLELWCKVCTCVLCIIITMHNNYYLKKSCNYKSVVRDTNSCRTAAKGVTVTFNVEKSNEVEEPAETKREPWERELWYDCLAFLVIFRLNWFFIDLESIICY